MKNLTSNLYYQEKNITIYNGDCIEVMKNLPNDIIDLVVTSPPYNCGIKYDIYNDAIDWVEYYNWCKEWLKEIYRIMKDDAKFCLIHYLSLGKSNNRQAPLMKLNTIAESVGFKHHALAIWWDITLTKKTAWGSWLSASAPYINSPFEGILILYKKYWKKIQKGITNIEKDEFIEACSGVWKIQPERNRLHPAPFPEKLASRCIKLLSYEGDMILDPFLGSGTVAVVSKKLNRKCIGIELSEQYCNISKNRLLNA